MMKAELDKILALDVVEDSGKIEGESVRLNRKAANLIIRYLNIDNLAFFSNLLPPDDQRDGHKIWNFFKAKYESNDSFSQILMRCVGFNQEEKPLAIMILSKLTSKLYGFMRMIVHGDLQSVETMLFKLEQGHKFFSIPKDEEVLPELHLLHVSKPRFTSCTHCGRPNHDQSRCWQLNPELIPDHLVGLLNKRTGRNTPITKVSTSKMKSVASSKFAGFSDTENLRKSKHLSDGMNDSSFEEKYDTNFVSF